MWCWTTWPKQTGVCTRRDLHRLSSQRHVHMLASAWQTCNSALTSSCVANVQFGSYLFMRLSLSSTATLSHADFRASASDALSRVPVGAFALAWRVAVLWRGGSVSSATTCPWTCRIKELIFTEGKETQESRERQYKEDWWLELSVVRGTRVVGGT